jgi:AcrR family transcriptional regulator
MSRSSASPSGQAPPSFQGIARAQKRSFILEAAAAEFGAKGFHSVTVKDIAARAGIAHGTFYLYFKDKKDVYREISRQLRSQIFDVILPDSGTDLLADGVELTSLVRDRLAELAQLFEREADFARVFLYRTPGADPQFEEQRRAFVRDLTDGVAAVLQAGAERGLVRRSDPKVAAICLIGSMDMIIESWLHGSAEEGGSSLREMMDEAARFVVAALRPLEPERRRTESASRTVARAKGRTE